MLSVLTASIGAYNIYKRAESTREIIKNYIKTTDIPEGHKVVLVAHFSFFKMYTGEHDAINEDMDDPEAFIEFENWQFVSDPTIADSS